MFLLALISSGFGFVSASSEVRYSMGAMLGKGCYQPEKIVELERKYSQALGRLEGEVEVSREDINSGFNVGPNHYWKGFCPSQSPQEGRINVIRYLRDGNSYFFFAPSSSCKEWPPFYAMADKRSELDAIKSASISPVRDEGLRQKLIDEVVEYYNNNPLALEEALRFEKRAHADLVEILTQVLDFEVHSFNISGKKAYAISGMEKRMKWGYDFLALKLPGAPVELRNGSRLMLHLVINGEDHLLIRSGVKGTGIVEYVLYKIVDSSLLEIFRESGFSN